jgi:head-tail adaptor
MSIDSFFTETFIPYTWTAGSVWPYENTWTAGISFKGAIDTVSSRESFQDGNLAGISSHLILTKANTIITKGMRIGYGSRTFDVVGPPDPIPIRPGHHAEIYVKEATT